MLEVTSTGQEATLGVDFAELYKNSELYKYGDFISTKIHI